MQLIRAAAGAASAAALVAGLAACSGNVTSLEAGDCFNQPENLQEITDVETVDCNEPHDNEVVLVTALEGGDDYPGDDDVAAQSADICTGDDVTDYLGAPIFETDLVPFPITPSSGLWESGNHNVICAVSSSSGRLEESVRDIGASDGDEGGDGDEGSADQFDALIADCEDGDLAACDELYFATPVGSPEEEIGLTCGGRRPADDAEGGTCQDELG